MRAARAAALRDFATASCVTQQVLTTATSARARRRSSCPSREQPLAHVVRVGVRDLAAEKADGERRHRRDDATLLAAFEQVGGPAVELASRDVRPDGSSRARVGRGSRRRSSRRSVDARASASTRRSAMFATATSAAGRSSASDVERRGSTSTPFAAAFAASPRPRSASTSTASTGAKPSFAAAIASTPEPQPTSSRLPRGSSSSSSRQSRVVGCAPVPNARPGSITTAIASAGGSSHGGPTQSGPTRTGRWNVRQRSAQSSATSSARAPPNARQSRSSPAGVGVGGELDAVRATRPPRSPPGRARACARAPPRRARRGHAPRRAEAAQRNALFSLSKKPSSGSVRLVVGERARTPRAAALLVGQPARHDDVDEHAVVAAAEALQHRHARGRAARAPRPAACPARTRARPRRRASATVTRRAERGLRDRQVDGREDVVALAHEALVGSDAHVDVDVAGAAAERCPRGPRR